MQSYPVELTYAQTMGQIKNVLELCWDRRQQYTNLWENPNPSGEIPRKKINNNNGGEVRRINGLL